MEVKTPHTNRPTEGELEKTFTFHLADDFIQSNLHMNIGFGLWIYFFTESVILEKIKKNKISKCVFLAQKALLTFRKDQANKETKKILEVSV